MSLSLPITKHGRVVAGATCTRTKEHAFDGRHETLAGIFGAWVGGAVANADVSFTTRQQPMKAPATLEDNAWIDTAVGPIIAIRAGSCRRARGASSPRDRRVCAVVPVGTVCRYRHSSGPGG